MVKTAAPGTRRRRLRVVTEAQGARVTVDGRSLVNFASNNYLGLARHPQVLEAVRDVLPYWGAGATASRLVSGSSSLHHDLEAALAAFLGREAALVFPTGYMANLGVVTALAGTGDALIIDRLCHASLIDAARLSGARLFVFKHADAGDAGRVLRRAASYRRLLVTESLFSMDGDFAPLPELAAHAQAHDTITLVDEAHAIGVWGSGKSSGEAGSGKRDCDVVVGTLSKALGSQGGFVAGPRELIETLVNRARPFIYSTGLSPLCAAAALAALSVMQEDPAPARRVQALSKRLRDELRAREFDILGSTSQIVPVLLQEEERALACADFLAAEGFYAPAIRPPTVHAGTSRIRLSVTSDHEEADIDALVAALERWRNRE